MKTMRFILFPLTVLMIGCSTPKEEPNIFGDVQKLSEFEKTDFVTTLESDFDCTKNQIYSPTVLFCWDEIRKVLNTNNISGSDLQKLDESKTFDGVLSDGFEVGITYDSNEIKAASAFNKTLSFVEPFEISEFPLNFKLEEVGCFEFRNGNHQAEIEYYNSDEDFAIVLQPEDTLHEIVLMKTDFTKFKDAKSIYKSLVKKNIKSNSGKVSKWRTQFERNDFTKIPLVKFNLKHSFEEFVGQSFVAEGELYSVTQVSQRNAFVLNQNGVKVESESTIGVKDAEMEEDPKTPKKLIFDNDFIVFLRMKDVAKAASYQGYAYPYFMVYITNGELLVPFN